MRHAHSNFDISIEEIRGLSETGWADVPRVTELLLQEGIDVVASSSYVRAIQTVLGMADRLGVEVIVDPRLRERDLTSRTVRIPLDEFPNMMKKVFAEPDFAFPEGESNNEVLARALAGLHDLLHNHPGRYLGTERIWKPSM